MTDEKKPGEVDAAAKVNKPKKTLTELIQESGFVDATKPGRAIGFVGVGGCTPPDSTPEEESSPKQ